ncbi:MAG: sialic acid TRAP transporter substrate-binding protein SiaP [Burkholderiales bacterium]
MTTSRRQSLLALASAVAAASLPLPARAQARKVRFGHQQPIDSAIHKGLVKAAEVAAAKTGGRVQIELFPASQLGSAREMMTQVIDANLDFIIDGPGALATLQRPLSIFEAPFLARDFDHLRKMLGSDWAKGQFAQLAQNRNMVNIGVWYYGVRHFTTKPRALNTAADTKGLKIRVPEAPLFLDMIRALGAAPTPMTLSEVYLALQTGVVDGQENPLPTINNNKFYEVQRYLNLTAHIIVPQLVMVNAKYWATLSDADRAAVIDAFAEGGKVNDALTREAEGRLVDEFKAKGMEIVRPDLASFRQAMTSVYPKYEDVWGKGTFETMQKL